MIGDVKPSGKRNIREPEFDTLIGSEIIGVATLSPALADGADFVRRVKEFQREAWDELYDTYFPKMYRYLYIRIGDRDVAEELAAEVFEQACRGVHRFRYRGVPFASWLYRVAHNVMVDCLARREAGAGLEECLRGHEALAAELRPLLEAAQALRARDVADYRPDAFQRGRARMHAARMSETERGGRPVWAGLWRPLVLTGVAAAVAALAAVGLTTGVLRFGADTTSAQVDGVVSRVDPDAIILITADGRVSVRIAENTIVLDANGNPINGDDITPGRSARVEVEEEDGEYSAQRIEVEDEDHEAKDAEVEFSGKVQTVSGGTLTVEASFGVATGCLYC